MAVMPCSWCGDWRGVRMVQVNGKPRPSPIPGVPLHLCPRCWGAYKEAGVRPGVGSHAPAHGPVTGLDLRPAMLRSLGGPVTPARTYTVGERGRETFVPTRDGTIIPRPRP